MPAIFFAILTYFGWGAGDIFGASVARKLGSFSTTFWGNSLSILLYLFYAPFVISELKHLTLELFFLNIFLGVLILSSEVFLNQALILIAPSLVLTIMGAFSGVTVLLSILFLGEHVNSLQICAILLILLGLFLSTIAIEEVRSKKIKLDKGVIFAFIAMLMWGAYFTFIKIPVKEIGWFWPAFFSSLPFPIILLFMKIRKLKLNKPNFKGGLKPLSLAVILLRSGDITYNIGIGRGLTAVVAPIAGSYSTLSALLGFIFFKDKITKQQILGIITTLVGIVLLSFFSV